jgi:cytochrome c-type biogenesis protein CcmH
MRLRIWLVLVFSIAVALIAAGRSLAQQPTPSDDEVNAVAKQLYCPVCENIPLDVCPTQACAQWRALIREKLAQGWKEDQIKQYFVSQYGDRVLAVPPVSGVKFLFFLLPIGFNIFLWVGVGIGMLVVAFIVYMLFKEGKKPIPQVSPGKELSGPDDQYVERLEEELRRRQ